MKLKPLLFCIFFLLAGQAALAQAPSITSFSPSSGPVGTLVTIKGVNLGNPTAFSIGGVAAITISNSGTQLVGMVMPGAATGSVSLTTPGGTAKASNNFTIAKPTYPADQQGGPLVGTNSTGTYQGYSVAISADCNTAAISDPSDNISVGAVWVFTRSSGIWTQQGNKLVGTGAVAGFTGQGTAVSLSADGNTLAVGGEGDNNSVGAAWIFTRNAGIWTQQGNKLIGTGASGFAEQGSAVSLSADGNTLVVGGPDDDGGYGASWVFTRSDTTWSQQGSKLVGTGGSTSYQEIQGEAVAISADGETIMVAGPAYYNNAGEAWIFIRNGGIWTQQGKALVETGAAGSTQNRGCHVALSADGNTAAEGDPNDNNGTGAVWIFTRSSGAWTQQGNKIIGSGAKGLANQGVSVALSADGNTMVSGAPADSSATEPAVGSSFLFTRTAGAWTQHGAKLVASAGVYGQSQGVSIALSADGSTMIVGGHGVPLVFFPSTADAALANLTLSTGTVSPVFAVDTINYYTALVGYGTSSITITPTTNSATATLTVNGTAAKSGSHVTLPVTAGANTIHIAVTASDGVTTRTYTLVVTTNTIIPPVISYATPATYSVGKAITPLSPVSSREAAPAYNSSPVTLDGTDFNDPIGVAVDAAGDVYVADPASGWVYKIPAGNGAPVTKFSGALNPDGIGVPNGVAADGAGDVYIADSYRSSVYEIIAGSTNLVAVGSGFSDPTGVAVDAAGDVYVADAGNNQVKKIPAGSNTPVVIGSGFVQPNGVSVDESGNVYVADYGNNAIKEIAAGSNTPVVIGSGFFLPSGVSVDAAGNIFVADYGNNAVKEIPAGSNTPVAIGAGFSAPEGLVVDGAGNVYVADAGNRAVKKITPAGGYYISPFLPPGLSFSTATGVISGTPTAASPATTYIITAYNTGGTGAATINITVVAPLPSISYTSPQTYIQGTVITPISPASSDVASVGYTSSPAFLGSGFNAPAGVAVDAAGDVFVADYANKLVKEIPAGSTTPVAISSGFTNPYGIAVDAIGNVYVADYGASAVYKIPAGSGTTVTPVAIGGSGFSHPMGVAVDAAGDVFVADHGNNEIKKIPAGSNTPVVIGFGFSGPVGIAVDAAGNLYVGDKLNNAVKEIPAGSNTPSLIGSGFSSPSGVSVDASGNVYVADYGNNAVKQIPVGSNTPIVIGGSGFKTPEGVTVDGAGNVYVADAGGNDVKKVKPIGGYYIGPFLPAGLAFNNTTGVVSGTPAAASPATTYTVTAYDKFGGGTAALSIQVSSGVPSLSYASPQTYTGGTAITLLTPTSANVAKVAYSSSPLILGSGFSAPAGVAADAAGDVFVADYAHKLVKEIPAGSTNPVTIGSGFTNPYGIAVDAAGNVYVADYEASAVYKISVGNGTTVVIGSGFNHPAGVAVDAAGDVFVADHLNNEVKKIPAGSNTPIVIGSGFSGPVGIAVDAAGNVYVGDKRNNAVKEIPAGSNTPVVIGSGFSSPSGVSVDASGNVYVADYGNNALKEIRSGSTAPIILGSGFKTPEGVAVDGAGNVYAADAGNNAIKKIEPAGGYYIGPFLPAGLTLNNGTGIISGTPAAASAATTYTVTAYNSAGSGTATMNITVTGLAAIRYASPQTYTQGRVITPLSPTGSGVASPGYSSSPAILGSGFSAPAGVATDAAGDVFVADYADKLVKEIPVGSNTPAAIGSGFTNPYGIAADAAGDVYVADYGANAVYKIPAGNGTPVILGSGFSHPAGVAIDAAGDVFVADHGNNEVKKIPAGSNTPIVIGSGFSGPVGIAVDAAGNVYVGDKLNNAVKEIPAGSNTPVVIGSGFSSPYGVSVDASGNVYIADYGNNAVKEIPAGSTASATPIVIGGSGLNTPEGVAVDGAGNVYVADAGNNAVKKIKPVGGYYIGPFLPAGLAFDNTTGIISGTPTAGSPATNYTVSAHNATGGGTATVNITVIPNTANLSNLVLSSGTLTPAFSIATTGYTANVAYTVTSITLTPTTTAATATVKVNGRTVKTGTASGAIPLNPGANTITTLVTAPDGVTTKSYTVTVTRVPPADAELRSLGLRAPFETLTTVTGPDYRDYTASVPHGFPSIEVLPVTSDPSSTITVNGTALTSGTTSNPLPLAVGPNPITIVVTAQDGVTTETYVITVTRAPASDALLSSVGLTNPFEELTVVTGPDFRDYTASVSSGTSSIETLLVSSDSAATITVNGTAVTSGTTSSPLPLAVGPNAITILVTAQDGVTTETYVITVTRAPASNAFLSSVGLTNPFEVLTTVTGPDYKDYTASVSSGTSSIEALPVTSDPAATLTVNGTAVTSGTTSNPLPLAVGPNAITIVVTAQDGVTTENYVITVTEAAPPAAFRPVNFTRMTDSTSMAIDGILVHQGVSPNGDGINDFLVIEGITQYPDNHLMIINRNGALVYQANGYDNSKGVFDGHSNINGRMQAQGTYFYALDYNVNGVIRHRTGYIVLKY